MLNRFSTILIFSCLSSWAIDIPKIDIALSEKNKAPREFYIQSHQTCLLRIETNGKVLKQGKQCLSIAEYLLSAKKTYTLSPKSLDIKLTKKYLNSIRGSLASHGSSLGKTTILFLENTQRDLLRIPLWTTIKFQKKEYFLHRNSLYPKSFMSDKEFANLHHWHHFFVLIEKTKKASSYFEKNFSKLKSNFNASPLTESQVRD